MSKLGRFVNFLTGAGPIDTRTEYEQYWNHPAGFRPFDDNYTYGATPQGQESMPRGPVRHEGGNDWARGAVVVTRTGNGHYQNKHEKGLTVDHADRGDMGEHRRFERRVEEYMNNVQSVLRGCGEPGQINGGGVEFNRGRLRINLTHPVQNAGAVTNALRQQFGRGVSVNGSTIYIKGGE